MVTMFFCFFPAILRKPVQSTYLHSTGTGTFQVPILPLSVAKNLSFPWQEKRVAPLIAKPNWIFAM